MMFPRWHSGKASACQCRRRKKRELDPRVRKSPWKRKGQLTPAFLPGESHGQRSLVGYSPWGGKESDTTEWLSIHTHKETTQTHAFLTTRASLTTGPFPQLPLEQPLLRTGCVCCLWLLHTHSSQGHPPIQLCPTEAWLEITGAIKMMLYIKQQADDFIRLVKQNIEVWSHHLVEKICNRATL